MSRELSHQELERFYNALSETQKSKVEDKLKGMLRENYASLPEESVTPIRYRVAADMFQVLQG
jgi:hypothetical protein